MFVLPKKPPANELLLGRYVGEFCEGEILRAQGTPKFKLIHHLNSTFENPNNTIVVRRHPPAAVSQNSSNA
jgi:hypothetical protein